MHYTPSTLFFDTAVRDVHLNLNVFIAYEDIATGKRAKETCDLMSANLGPDWQMDTRLASFKALSLPKMRRAAVVEAASADVLVISCNNSRLPFGVTDWLELLLGGDHRTMALVALFSCRRPASKRATNAETSLADTARQRRVQFFSRFQQATPGQWEWHGRQPSDLGEWGGRTML